VGIVESGNQVDVDALQVVGINEELFLADLMLTPERIDLILDFFGAAIVQVLDLAHGGVHELDFYELLLDVLVAHILLSFGLVPREPLFYLILQSELLIEGKLRLHFEGFEAELVIVEVWVVDGISNEGDLLVVVEGVEIDHNEVHLILDDLVCDQIHNQRPFHICPLQIQLIE